MRYQGADPALSGVVTDTGFSVSSRSRLPLIMRRLPVEAVGEIIGRGDRSEIHVRLVSFTPYLVLPLLAVFWLGVVLVGDRSAQGVLAGAWVTGLLTLSLAIDRLRGSRQIRLIFESIYFP